MHRKEHVNITLDSDVLKWLDTLRGQKPRSTFINSVLSGFCSKSRKLFDWEKEEKLADEDIRKGRVRKFKDNKKAVQWLKS